MLSLQDEAIDAAARLRRLNFGAASAGVIDWKTEEFDDALLLSSSSSFVADSFTLMDIKAAKS